MAVPRVSDSGRRQGATLVEMIVVIAIIAILAALTFMGVRYAYDFGEKIEGEAAFAASQIGGGERLQAPAKAKTLPAKNKKKPRYVPDSYVVMLKPGAGDPAAAAATIAKDLGATVKGVVRSVPNFASFVAPNKTERDFANHPLVALSEKEQYYYTTTDLIPTGVARIKTNPKANISYQRPPTNLGLNLNVKKNLTVIPTERVANGKPLINVAVVDTGVDSTHPDLNVVYSEGFDGFISGEDVDGHGTHVAGTIGAMSNNKGVIGVNPGVRIWSIRVLGVGGGTTTSVLGGYAFVRNNAQLIDVANSSIGGGLSATINAIVDSCSAAGVIMVVAAGNDSDDAKDYSPASAPGAICVAAWADSNGRPGGNGPATSAGPDDTFADFSNYGAVVEVIAPGTDILSTWPAAFGMSYNTISGTSMACPNVAGIMSLYAGGYLRVAASNTAIIPKRGSSPSEILQIFRNAGALEDVPGIYDTRTYPMINLRAPKN